MISLIVWLIVIGVAMYLIGMIPMDPTFLKLIRVVAIIVAVLVVLQAFGLVDGLTTFPRVRGTRLP